MGCYGRDKKEERKEAKKQAPSFLAFLGESVWLMENNTFVKAASSTFMKLRNSVLESVLLLPSLPAYFWKTAIRDSMHLSVSVGPDMLPSERKIQGQIHVKG